MPDIKQYLHTVDLVNNKITNLLLNPLTTAQRTTVGGTLGLSDQGYVCYDTDLNQQYFWNGTSWVATGGGSQSFQDVLNVNNIVNQSAGNYDFTLNDNSGNINFISSYQIYMHDTLGSDNATYNMLGLQLVNSSTSIGTNYANGIITFQNPLGNFSIENITEPKIYANSTYFKFATVTPINSNFYLPISVNGNVADAAGNITVTTSGGGIPHATASGTDTYTATVTGVTSYTDGDAYIIQFTNGNTTGCTLNINGLGARPLYRNNDAALIGGDIQANGEMLCVYDATVPAFRTIGTSPNTLLSYVTNDDSVTLTKGMPVYAFSGTGDRMTVKRANNTSDATSAQTVGLVLSSSIGVNQKGFIIMQGLLDGLSILPTSTWADGSPVYLGSTAGSITPTKPYAPNHLVYLGFVTTASNGSAGRMYVRVQNGYELDELHNVQAQSPTYKDTLWYDNTVSPAQWKTASISTILGYTPFQLPSLTAGSVLFSNGTTIAQDNANFFWDDANNRLGIGTASPSYKLEVVDNGVFSRFTQTAATNTNAILLGKSTSSYIDMYGSASERKLLIGNGATGYADLITYSTNTLRISAGGTLPSILSTFTPNFTFSSGTNTHTIIDLYPNISLTGGTNTLRGVYYHPNNTAGTATTEIAWENTQGDIIHGNLAGATTRMVTADATGKLGVQAIPSGGTPAGSTGYVQFNTSGAFNADANLFWDNTNKRLGIGTSSPSYPLHILGKAVAIASNSDANGEAFTVLQNTATPNPGGAFYIKDNTNTNFLGGFSMAGNNLRFANYTASGNMLLWAGSSDRVSLFGSTGNVAIGTTTDAGFKLDVNGTGRISGQLSIEGGGGINFAGNGGGNRFRLGNATVYRTTNAGGALTSPVLISPSAGQDGSIAAGALGWVIDNDDATGLSFLAGNGTNHIARANITITNLVNTAGSESGDLIFLTQSGGTAMSEKMRIFGNGNIAINTTSDNGYKLYVSGSIGSSSNLVLLGGGIGATRFIIGSISTYKESNVTQTPNVLIATNGVSGSALVWDRDNDRGLVFCNGNTGFVSQAARASIKTVATVNTVGSEAGDLLFSTANSAALSERMRILANGNVGIGTSSPANTLDVVRGTAGGMGRGTYETASFSYNADMKFGLYTSSSNSTHGAGLSFGQTNLTITATGYYPGFDHQYVYGSTPATNAMRYNYTERNSTGTVVNYAANLMQVYGDGKIVFSPVASGVSTTVKMLINTSTDDAVNTLQVNGSVKSTQFRLSALNTAPATAADTGTTGEIRIVNGFIYVCVATNTWQRVAIATW